MIRVSLYGICVVLCVLCDVLCVLCDMLYLFYVVVRMLCCI